MNKECDICTREADKYMKRVEVWSNETWRLTTTTFKKVQGLCYLEPKRHIEYITDLDGQEALEFGIVLAKVTNILKNFFKASLIYVYIFGGHIPHLHVHLAPHTENDIFFDNLVKDDKLVSKEIIAENELQLFIQNVQNQLRV